MRPVDIGELLRKTVLRLNKKHAGAGPSLQLHAPPGLPPLTLRDGTLERAIEKIIYQASVIGRPSRAVKIAVRPKPHWQDLEDYFDLHPPCWIQMSIDIGASGFGELARGILKDHGYGSGDSVEVENTSQRLDVFYLEADRAPKLLLWTKEHRFNTKCALLIPLAEPLRDMRGLH
jgi:hypothetical protein